MYILNYRRKRSRTILAVGLLVVGLGGATYMGRQMMTAETEIGPAPAAVITQVRDGKKAPLKVNEPLMSFELPNDWEKFTPVEAMAGSQSWRNTADNKGVRTITIFTDAMPRVTAVNRIVAVQPSEDGLMLAGDISDNCVNFTNPGQQASATGTATAKWGGVEFVCDTGNYIRNLAGVGMAGVPKGVKLTGPTTGQHTLFILYNDSTASPNFGIFTSMLQSLKLK